MENVAIYMLIVIYAFTYEGIGGGNNYVVQVKSFMSSSAAKLD